MFGFPLETSLGFSISTDAPVNFQYKWKHHYSHGAFEQFKPRVFPMV